MSVGKVAKQIEALNYPKTGGVNVADRWSERLRSYLGRSARYVVDMNLEITNHTVMYA